MASTPSAARCAGSTRSTWFSTGPAVAAWHRLGVAVFAWTVDDPGRIRHLARLGVDGVITDCPDVARDALMGLVGDRDTPPEPGA